MTDEPLEELPPLRVRLLEICAHFLRLGFTAFGGPAAHIALYQDEFVRRRKWLSETHFLDLLGAVNLIPGPNSTEMAIHIGYLRGGWPGLILSGVCFTTPAMLIVLGLSWFYVKYGSLPQMEWLLYGIKPVMIVIILQAIYLLGKKAVKKLPHALLGLAAMLLSFTSLHPLVILFGGGLLYLLYQTLSQRETGIPAALVGLLRRPLLDNAAPRRRFLASITASIAAGGGLAAAAVPFSMLTLFLTFLKIGTVLYGSGYVLIAFLEADFVRHLGWITEKQLLEAVSIGQVTPGPLFTAATFIGYLTGGVPGALLATLAIFLPSFILVALSNPLIPRIRSSRPLSRLLDGVNIASLGLMAAVTVVLGRSAWVDPVTIILAAVAACLLFRYRLNSTWLILGGAITGLLRFWLF